MLALVCISSWISRSRLATRPYLHLVGVRTRFQAATFIAGKSAAKIWKPLYGLGAECMSACHRLFWSGNVLFSSLKSESMDADFKTVKDCESLVLRRHQSRLISNTTSRIWSTSSKRRRPIFRTPNDCVRSRKACTGTRRRTYQTARIQDIVPPTPATP